MYMSISSFVIFSQSYTRTGVWRQGIGSFCKELLCFDTMPCRHMPLLVHFWFSLSLSLFMYLYLSLLPASLRAPLRLGIRPISLLSVSLLIFASFVLCVVYSVKDHHDLRHDSPRLKKTCGRQVVLNKRFPPRNLSRAVVAPRARLANADLRFLISEGLTQAES